MVILFQETFRRHIGDSMQKKIYYPKLTDTAKSMGSGSLEVLATPALVAYMENIAFETLQEQLNEGQSSVGTLIKIDHLAASLITSPVIIRITDWRIDGRKHHFNLQAYVEEKLIASAQHTRFVVDVERFLGNLK